MIDLRQPTGTTCGQTCVAMLLGLDVDQVVREVGHGKGTTWPELHKVLRAHDWSGWPKLSPRGYRHAPVTYFGDSDYALCRVRWGERKYGAHWVLWAEGAWHDPLCPGKKPHFLREVPHLGPHLTRPAGRVLSYVLLTPPSPQPEEAAE